ncbi:hypothetical protein ACWEWX_52445, partial [Streptomyces asiaticus]
MGSHLFAELARRTLDDARHEVEVYGQEIPEYRFVEHDGRRRAEALDYAVWLRRRTLDLAPDGTPLSQEDLDHIASMGASRARTGMSAASRRRVLGLHTNLMLREIQEASGPENTDELMRLMAWFTAQGTRGIDAYTRGHAAEQKRRLPLVARVRALTTALLADDSLAPGPRPRRRHEPGRVVRGGGRPCPRPSRPGRRGSRGDRRNPPDPPPDADRLAPGGGAGGPGARRPGQPVSSSAVRSCCAPRATTPTST